MYEADLGEIDPGAYAIRVIADAAGCTRPWGGRSGWWRRPPAEYRVLGTNEAFLATLRAATAGRAIETPAEPWIARPDDERRLDRPLAAGSWSSPCSCGRSTSPCGGSRSAGASWPTRGAGWPVGRDGRWRRARARSRGCSPPASAPPARRPEPRCCATTEPSVAPDSPAAASSPTPIPAPAPRLARRRRRRRAPARAGAPRRRRRLPTSRRAREPTPDDTLARLRDAKRRRGGPTADPAAPVYARADVPDRPALVRRVPLAAVAVAVAAAARRCGTISRTPPVPTPADFQGIAGAMVQRGIKVSHVVSGDAGCATRTWRRRPSRSTPSGSTRRRPSASTSTSSGTGDTYERLRSTVDDCARSYVTDPARTSRSRPRRTSSPARARGASSSRTTCGPRSRRRPERASDPRPGSARPRAGPAACGRSRAAGPGSSPPRSR